MRFEILNEIEEVIDIIDADLAFMQSQYQEWQYRQAPDLPIVPTVPTSITMRQARLALLNANLLDDVDAAINSLASPQKETARITWEYSTEVQRNNGLVSVLAPALGLSESDLDDLFILGDSL